MHDDLDGTLASLEVRVTAPDMARANVLISGGDEVELIGVVTLVEADHSWSDLRRLSRVYSGNETGEVIPARYDATDSGELRRLLTEFKVSAVGYSIADNLLVAYIPKEGSDAPSDLRIGAMPRVRLLPEQAEPVDIGPQPCLWDGCGTSRGGIEVRKGTDIGTLGFAVTDSGNESYLVSGHFLSGLFRTNFIQDSGSYPGSLNFNQLVTLGVSQDSGWYVGSRIDGQEVAESDHLVTNRLIIGPGLGSRVTSWLLYSQVMINLKVCKTGRSTGLSCGKVVDVGDTANPTGLGGELIDQIRSDYHSDVGDSGAPVFLQTDYGRLVSLHGGGVAGNKYSGSVSHLGDIDPGMIPYTITDKRKDYILALYSAGLGRHADLGGYNYWRFTAMSTCNLTTARTTATGILTSSEFRNAYPLTTNGRKLRVEKAYWAALGRRSDTGGFNYWLGQLTSESAWTNTVAGFVHSAEFQIRITGAGSGYDGDVC